jgi:hypothetical protein
VLVGASSAGQMRENIGVLRNTVFSEDELAEIEAVLADAEADPQMDIRLGPEGPSAVFYNVTLLKRGSHGLFLRSISETIFRISAMEQTAAHSGS